MTRLGRPTQRQRQWKIWYDDMHTYKDKNITNFTSKQNKRSLHLRLKTKRGTGCRLLRPWVFSVGQRRARPDVFLGPTVSYGEQGANRGGHLRRKGLTQETEDQKIKPVKSYLRQSRFKGSAVKLVTYDMVKTQDAMWPGNRSFELTRRDFEEIAREDPDRSV